jgi:cyanophycin synthetase
VVNRGYFHGYDYRSTQPCLRLRIRLPLDTLSDGAWLDAWLSERFLVDRARLAEIQSAPKDNPRAPVRATLDRALLIYGELARAAKFPCFDHGHVIALHPVAESDDAVEAEIMLPVVDNMPRSAFVRLFTGALDAVRDCSRIDPASDQGDPIFARLNELIEAVLKNSPPRGVANVAMCEILHRHDIPFRHFGGGVMRLGMGREGRLFQKSAIQADSAVGAASCVDKRSTARLLLAAGLPGAEHMTVGSPEAALAAAKALGWPVVVKPADRERSDGVTAGLSDEAALVAAYEEARRYSPNVLVERHVAGMCHRILVAAGKILYVVKRIPKRVEGNGRDSIAALAAAANATQTARAPWKQLRPHPLDALALACLAADGFTPASVPQPGQFAYLRPLAKADWGGVVEELTGAIHPANAELAIAAADLFGLRVAGVDLITDDIAVPWHVNGAIINEMNYRPELKVTDRAVDASLLLDALAEGDGRIPVHLVTGTGDLDLAAREVKQRLADAGRRCHSTSSAYTHSPDGAEVPIAAATLFERTLALVTRPDVDEIILIGSPGELFERGLAVDRLDSLYVVEADPADADRLLDQLQARFTVQSASIFAGQQGSSAKVALI